MSTTIKDLKSATWFHPQVDQMETMGTQIQWKEVENAEAGIVLLAAETEGPPIHLHPTQQEEFFIRYGELTVFKKDSWITLKSGETLIIPPNTPHTYKNTSKDMVMFDFELSPRVRFRKMIEEMDVYVQQQKIRGTDFKSILYLCRVMANFPDVTQSVKPPQVVVKVMAAVSRILQR